MYYPCQAKYIAPAVLDKVARFVRNPDTQASLYIVEVRRVWIRAIPSSAPIRPHGNKSTNNHCEIVLQESQQCRQLLRTPCSAERRLFTQLADHPFVARNQQHLCLSLMPQTQGRRHLAPSVTTLITRAWTIHLTSHLLVRTKFIMHICSQLVISSFVFFEKIMEHISASVSINNMHVAVVVLNLAVNFVPHECFSPLSHACHGDWRYGMDRKPSCTP
jgi:hypothetical protein